MEIEHRLPTLPMRSEPHCVKMPTALEDFRKRAVGLCQHGKMLFPMEKAVRLLGVFDFWILVGDTGRAGQTGLAI
jgi:hypothetical protein